MLLPVALGNIHIYTHFSSLCITSLVRNVVALRPVLRRLHPDDQTIDKSLVLELLTAFLHDPLDKISQAEVLESFVVFIQICLYFVHISLALNDRKKGKC